MDRRIYTLQKIAQNLKATIVNFPITFGGVPLDKKDGTNELHVHDSLEMVLITAGHGIHVLGEQRAPVRKGDVLLVYPHILHGYEEADSMSRINIVYDPTMLPLPILDGERIPLFRHFFPLDLEAAGNQATASPLVHFETDEILERVVADALLLLDELTNKQPGNMISSVVRLMSVILMTLRLGTSQLEEDTGEKRTFSLGKVLKYLNKNFTREISLNDLARMSIYSVGAFQRKFKNLTGYSVTEYVLRKRIALAKTLLRKEPEKPIGEVGFLCGFIDANYFTRQFRRIAGKTPREWRRAKDAEEEYVE